LRVIRACRGSVQAGCKALAFAALARIDGVDHVEGVAGAEAVIAVHVDKGRNVGALRRFGNYAFSQRLCELFCSKAGTFLLPNS